MSRASVVLLLSLAAACSSEATPVSAPAQPRRPSAQLPVPAQVSGTVAETMDAAGYTYLKIKTAGGEVWAAVTQAAIKPGAEVAVVDGNWMEGFESKTLKRTFDRILFGTLAGSRQSAAAGGAASRPASRSSEPPSLEGAHAGLATGGADLGEIKVQKAEGGHTVAEIYAAKGTLKGKEVAVRGKVVKFNGGILGRNWVHIRDGSGSRDQSNDDLTVTTQDTVAVGDVVLVRGTLALEQDFGAGYSYPVIVEEAKLTK